MMFTLRCLLCSRCQTCAKFASDSIHFVAEAYANAKKIADDRDSLRSQLDSVLKAGGGIAKELEELQQEHAQLKSTHEAALQEVQDLTGRLQSAELLASASGEERDSLRSELGTAKEAATSAAKDLEVPRSNFV